MVLMAEATNPAAIESPAAQRTNNGPWSVLWQGFGAALWGVFFSIAPIVEVLLLLSPLWFSLFVLGEVARSRKYGFLPGFAVRILVISAVVTAAALAPFKYEDEPLARALPASHMSLKELSEALVDERIHFSPSAPDGGTMITLPSRHPTIRQVIEAIQEPTHLVYTPRKCGNCMTILGGAAPIGSFELASITPDAQ